MVSACREKKWIVQGGPRKDVGLTGKSWGREWLFCVKLSMRDSSQVGSSLRSCPGLPAQKFRDCYGSFDCHCGGFLSGTFVKFSNGPDSATYII